MFVMTWEGKSREDGDILANGFELKLLYRYKQDRN